MIAVVTGASGFIGANLVESLVADGVEVRLLRRAGASQGPLPRGTTAHTVDIFADDARHASLWQGATHVFHLAARTRALDPLDFVNDNVKPTARLAEVLAQLKSVPRLVFVSSQAAAGPARAANAPVTDSDASQPMDPYGRSKFDAEAAVRAEGLPAVIVRPSSVYGPRDRDFLQVFEQLRRPLALQASPSWHRLSLVHVHDVVAALRLVALRDEALGRSFFVEDGAPATWGAVYDEVAAVLRRSPPRVTVPAAALQLAAIGSEFVAGLRGVDPLLTRAKLELARHPYWLCEASGLREVFGWHARVSRADGWASTYEWYREARWIRS
jgi:nucleoside-diphosphate-sugar epimerase